MIMDSTLFEQLAGAYGAELKRWPAEHREAAQDFLRRESSAKQILSGHERLDAMLALDPPVKASAALKDRILASASETFIIWFRHEIRRYVMLFLVVAIAGAWAGRIRRNAMTTGNYNRGLWTVLILSLCANVFLVGFTMAWGAAFAHPQAAIHKQFQKWVNQLPDQYRKGAQAQLDDFYTSYAPVIANAEHERRVFLDMLLSSNVDAAKALAEGGKIRELTAKIQEGVQAALIAALKDIPRDEKMKVVENNRLLRAIVQDAGQSTPAGSPPATR
jgi:uncharacterized membrane protein